MLVELHPSILLSSQSFYIMATTAKATNSQSGSGNRSPPPLSSADPPFSNQDINLALKLIPSLPPPFKFSGDANSVLDFLDQFSDWVSLYGIPDTIVLAHARLALISPALDWFRNLNPTPTTFSDFCTALRTRFYRCADKAKARTLLFSRVHLPHESTSEYISSVRKLARRAEVEEDSLVEHVKNNLLPSLRHHLHFYQTPITSLAQLEALLGDPDLLLPSAAPSSQSAAIDALISEVRELRTSLVQTSATKLQRASPTSPLNHPPISPHTKPSSTQPFDGVCRYCKEAGHTINSCKKRSKCFICHEFGHSPRNCPRVLPDPSASTAAHPASHSPAPARQVNMGTNLCTVEFDTLATKRTARYPAATKAVCLTPPSLEPLHFSMLDQLKNMKVDILAPQLLAIAPSVVQELTSYLANLQAPVEAPSTNSVRSFPFVPATIMGKSVDAIIDTGSLFSIIDLSFCKSLGATNLLPAAYSLRSFSNHSVRPAGTLSAIVTVGGSSCNLDLAVVSDSPYELLLGNNWIHGSHAVLDLPSNKVVMGSIEVPMVPTRLSANTLLLRAEKSVNLAPFSETFVPAVADRSFSPEPLVTVNPSWSPPAIIDPICPGIFCQNLSSKPKLIRANEVVSVCVPLHDSPTNLPSPTLPQCSPPLNLTVDSFKESILALFPNITSPISQNSGYLQLPQHVIPLKSQEPFRVPARRFPLRNNNLLKRK